MRTSNFIFVLLLSFAFTAPSAFAQAPKRPISEYSPKQTNRRADTSEEKKSLARGSAGQLRSYDQSDAEHIHQRPRDPYTPLYAIGLILFLSLCCLPVGMKLHRDNQKRLAAEASFGRNQEGSGMSENKSRYDATLDGSSDKLATLGDNANNKPSVPLVSPDELRERVWNILIDAQKWLSAEGVARLAQLDPEQAREELQTLVQEGHIEHSKDRTGRPIYKMPG